VIVLLIEYAINVVPTCIGRGGAIDASPPANSNIVDAGVTTTY